MNKDFHYYATYCAAILAGYTHEESMEICWASQFTDHCTALLLNDVKGPLQAATTQYQSELADQSSHPINIQNMTRIWASFHFLPYDLYAVKEKRPKAYMRKYRLICKPNGILVKDTIELAKQNGTLQAVGLSMHVLADTWAHSYFAGTPSLVINHTNDVFYEIRNEEKVKIRFRHTPGINDDLEKNLYTNSLEQTNETSIMNLGHGRAGHLPDLSFIKYEYMPAWDDYGLIIKDNPNEYYKAFTQMVYAMKYIRGVHEDFKLLTYDEETVLPWKDEIMEIFRKRQLDDSKDWKRLAEKISGYTLEDFSIEKYRTEYKKADKKEKENTVFGKYFIAAIDHKNMVVSAIVRSGSRIAGFAKETHERRGFRL